MLERLSVALVALLSLPLLANQWTEPKYDYYAISNKWEFQYSQTFVVLHFGFCFRQEVRFNRGVLETTDRCP